MLTKQVIAYGQPIELRCDGRCSKAWGSITRPHLSLDPSDEDDIVFLADHEIEGNAPADNGEYEGGHSKPSATDLPDGAGHQMNRWCFRQCERCVEAPKMPRDWTKRLYNIPSKHPAA